MLALRAPCALRCSYHPLASQFERSKNAGLRMDARKRRGKVTFRRSRSCGPEPEPTHNIQSNQKFLCCSGSHNDAEARRRTVRIPREVINTFCELSTGDAAPGRAVLVLSKQRSACRTGLAEAFHSSWFQSTRKKQTSSAEVSSGAKGDTGGLIACAQKLASRVQRCTSQSLLYAGQVAAARAGPERCTEPN